MKFARYIEALQRDCPPEWRGRFLKYKELKKTLKKCQHEEKGEEPDTATEDAFFLAIARQMSSINKLFQHHADRIIASYRRSQRRPALCCFLGPKRLSHEQEARMANEAYWCRKYAKANAVALRKILKKHDKLCGNMRGRAYLQQCWRSTGIGLFLHSPLLDELKAIQAQLEARQVGLGLGRDQGRGRPSAKRTTKALTALFACGWST